MLYTWLNNLSVLHVTSATFLATVSKTHTSPLPRMLPSSSYQSWTLYYKNSSCRITFPFVCLQGLWNNESKLCKTRQMVDVVYFIAQQLWFHWTPATFLGILFHKIMIFKFDQAPQLFSTLWIQKIKHAPSDIASKITRFHNLAAPVVRCCSVSHFSLPWKMRIHLLMSCQRWCIWACSLDSLRMHCISGCVMHLKTCKSNSSDICFM